MRGVRGLCAECVLHVAVVTDGTYRITSRCMIFAAQYKGSVSDSWVYIMLCRLLELEAAGVDTTVCRRHRRRGEEKREEPEEESEEARRLREELEKREQQREDRDRRCVCVCVVSVRVVCPSVSSQGIVCRRRELKRQRREAAERAHWQGVITGIERQVNSQYGYKPSPGMESEQVWAPDTFFETSAQGKVGGRTGGSVVPQQGSAARGGGTAGKGIGSTGRERGRVQLSLRSADMQTVSPEDDISAGGESMQTYSTGKRWKVAETKRTSIYSLNPVPGLGVSSAADPIETMSATSKAIAASRRRPSGNW